MANVLEDEIKSMQRELKLVRKEAVSNKRFNLEICIAFNNSQKENLRRFRDISNAFKDLSIEYNKVSINNQLLASKLELNLFPNGEISQTTLNSCSQSYSDHSNHFQFCEGHVKKQFEREESDATVLDSVEGNVETDAEENYEETVTDQSKADLLVKPKTTAPSTTRFSVLSSVTNLSYGVARKIYTVSKKSSLDHVISHFYKSCAVERAQKNLETLKKFMPETDKNVDWMFEKLGSASNFFCGNASCDILMLQNDFTQISTGANGQNQLFSKDPEWFQRLSKMPPKVLRSILFLIVCPLKSPKNNLGKWHEQRIKLYLFRTASRTYTSLVPAILNEVDERDVFDMRKLPVSTVNRLLFDQYRRNIVAHPKSLALLSSRLCGGTVPKNTPVVQLVNREALKFSLSPAETLYTTEIQRFRPEILKSHERSMATIFVSSMFNAATVSNDLVAENSLISVCLELEIDGTIRYAQATFDMAYKSTKKTTTIDTSKNGDGSEITTIVYKVRRDEEETIRANQAYEEWLNPKPWLITSAVKLPWTVSKFSLQAVGVFKKAKILELTFDEKLENFQRWVDQKKSGKITLVNKITILELGVPLRYIFGGFK
ncbi:hypothetical protein HK100_000513 [Physocladia obscura]|uniref:Uncharacterized protein n=1 Tax=Physocladia obscura TaxID=109957 RepID=A0AAD5SZT4_9FUNG|nr:hypothetical protein HK100_000513 [Physocladia obscura]